jgi:hypothetical protein
MGMRKGGRAMLMPSNYQGDGSTLNLDFTTMGGVLDPRLTFTRSTTATYINSSGYVTSAAINAPRFDYSPTNIGEPRGLLIEGQSTNSCLQSSNPASWLGASSGTTITTGTGLAPDNLTTPKQIALTSGAYHYQSSPTGVIAATYTLSVWLKASSTQSVGIRICRNSDGAIKGMITATVTTSWQRFEVSFTSNATDAIDFGFDQRDFGPGSPVVGPAVAATFLMWGAQAELGGASSYIPTGASQVTRTVDTCYMSGISSWYNESAGTVISNLTYNGLATNNSGIELSVGTGTSATNRIGIRKTYVDYYSGGGSAQAEMYPTVTSGNVRIGTAYSLNDFAMCSNGGTMLADGSGAVPVGLNTLKLYADNGTSGLVINGLIKSIKYFPTRLSNAQLQALTTP